MTTIVFDINKFKKQFPAFTSSDTELETNWDIATCYISDNDYGYLSGNCRERAIMLMAAHITAISDDINSGGTPNFITSSSIDNISVTATPPPNQDEFSWWLSLTPYGSQLNALLAANSVGGIYIGGSPEKSAFRKFGGFF